MNWHEDNSFTAGKTPLVRIQRVIPGNNALVLAKIEGRNPAYSVKCRIGSAMIWDAEQRAALRPGMEIVEPTSGNTGIALACVGAARGYKVTLTMPETMSAERRKLMRAFGANVVLTEGARGMAGAVRQAEELVQANPEKFFMPQQFKNPANPAIHEKTTAPEIWHDTQGAVDAIVAGVGTGGTITGTVRFFKKNSRKKIRAIAVEPAASPLLSQKRAGQPLRPAAHGIQGIGANFIPDTLDLSVIDEVETITDAEAMEFARRLASDEGILCGISSGAAMAAAARQAVKPEMQDKTIVVILPDSGERYLSTQLFEET